MKIIIATDTVKDQVNGVVRSIQSVMHELKRIGHTCTLISPELFGYIDCPLYPEVKLSLNINKNIIKNIIRKYDRCFVHIMTEGPVGLAVRRYCVKNNINFTTSYLTKFPE